MNRYEQRQNTHIRGAIRAHMGMGGDAVLSACARIRRRRNARPSQRRVGGAAVGSPHSADRRRHDSGAALNPAARADAGAAMGVRRAAAAILRRGRVVGGHTIRAVRAGTAGGGVGWDAGVGSLQPNCLDFTGLAKLIRKHTDDA